LIAAPEVFARFPGLRVAVAAAIRRDFLAGLHDYFGVTVHGGIISVESPAFAW
jgi:hypothetical protein